jgi:hypothetical protein
LSATKRRVQRSAFSNCPTQAKTGPVWAIRPAQPALDCSSEIAISPVDLERPVQRKSIKAIDSARHDAFEERRIRRKLDRKHVFWTLTI